MLPELLLDDPPLDDPPLDEPPLEDCVVPEEDEPLLLDPDEEFDPQAATPSAATTSSNAVQRRGDPIVTGCIIAHSCRYSCATLVVSSVDA
jgi:hypothetical protein